MTRKPVRYLTAVAAALLVTACGGGTPSTPADTGTPVTATLTDFHIDLAPAVTTPGTYTFKAVNAGRAPHALVIDGPGVPATRTAGTLQPGQSATVTVTLQSGSYQFYCPVDGHKSQGMALTVTTTGSATQTTTPGGPGGGY